MDKNKILEKIKELIGDNSFFKDLSESCENDRNIFICVAISRILSNCLTENNKVPLISALKRLLKKHFN